MALPIRNLKVSEIRSTLNANGGSVDNRASTFFSTSANLNFASKHKPIILPVLFCQDNDSTKPNYNAEWWLGSSQKCGLESSPCSLVTDLPSKYDNDMNGWSYNIPKGGINQPRRLGDFRGYDPSAKPPAHSLSVYDVVITSSAEKLVASINFNGINYNSISFLDMPILKNYYFGVLVMHNTRGTYTVNTNTTPIKSGLNTINIKPNALIQGKHTVYPFIAEEVQLQSQTLMSNIIYTLPKVSPLEINALSTDGAYTLTISVKSATALMLTFVIQIRNNTASAKTFTNNYIRVRPTGSSYDEPLTSDDYEEKLENITVESEQTYQVTKTVQLRGYAELQQIGIIYVSLDSADIVKSASYTISSGGDIM